MAKEMDICNIELLTGGFFIISVYRFRENEPMTETIGHIRPIVDYYEKNQDEF